MKRIIAIIMVAVFCMSMLSATAFAEPAAEGESAAAGAEGESAAGESEGGSAAAGAEGESAAGESGEDSMNEFNGQLAFGTAQTDEPTQDYIIEEGEEVYEGVEWSGEGGFLRLNGASAQVGGEEDLYEAEPVIPLTAEYFESSAVEMDDGYNSTFCGTADAAGGGNIFHVTGENSSLFAENIYAYAQGSRTADMYADGTNDVMAIQNSYLEAKGSIEGYEEVSDFIALQALQAWGHTRSNLSQGQTTTYYYNSVVASDGWAAMSTDGAKGLGVNFVSVNSYSETADGGYAIFSDHECRDYIFGTTLVGAEFGAIIASGGELYLLNGENFDLENQELNTYRQSIMDTYSPDLLSTSYQNFPEEHPVYALAAYKGDVPEVGRTRIVGGRNCVLMFLMQGMNGGGTGAEGSKQNVLTAQSADFVVDHNLFSLDDLPEGYYTPEDITSSAFMFYPETLNYVLYTSGAAILMRSCSSLVVLDDVTFTSNYNELEGQQGQADTFIMAVPNSDGNANLIPDGEEANPMDIHISNSEIEGNILDEDYQREMKITLSASTLTGKIEWHNVDDWNALWGADGSLGQGNYSYDETYETVWGPVVTLTDGSVWNVTEESYVKDLIVDDSSEVNGIVEEYENGYKVMPAEAAE